MLQAHLKTEPSQITAKMCPLSSVGWKRSIGKGFLLRVFFPPMNRSEKVCVGRFIPLDTKVAHTDIIFNSANVVFLLTVLKSINKLNYES